MKRKVVKAAVMLDNGVFGTDGQREVKIEPDGVVKCLRAEVLSLLIDATQVDPEVKCKNGQGREVRIYPDGQVWCADGQGLGACIRDGRVFVTFDARGVIWEVHRDGTTTCVSGARG